MMNDTVKLLCEKLGSVADAALIFSDTNILYYADFALTDSCLLVTPTEALVLTDSRYTEALARKIGERYVADTTGTMFDYIKEYFASHGVKRVAIENDRLTVAELDRLVKRLPDAEFVTGSELADITTALRRSKTEPQLARISAAQRIAEEAFDYICGFIKPGMTEKEVQLALDYHMLSHGADALSFETICVAGANSSLPHGVPGQNVIKEGDFLTMDYGALKDGYHSDMTRTVAIGRVSEKMKEVYSTVLEAQLAGLAILAPGVSCKDADAAARDVIEKAGYGRYFGHGTGHGVGVEIHEQPGLSYRSTQTLEPGDVVTVEPGIYLPGEFGVRIEDMAYITPDGSVGLTNCPKELIIL